jgi:type I restriction enzyme R subunit
MRAAAMLSTFQSASNSLRSSHHPPLASAKIVISTRFNNKQQAFLDFLIYHYVRVGIEELDQEKLTALLRFKYHNSISDALADLGQAEEIGQVFAGFQKYLYQPQAFA